MYRFKKNAQNALVGANYIFSFYPRLLQRFNGTPLVNYNFKLCQNILYFCIEILKSLLWGEGKEDML